MKAIAYLRYRNYVIGVASVTILVLMPYFMGSAWLGILIYTLLYIYLCSAWNISALPGLFSLMQGVFFGCGGYISAILLMKWNFSPWLGMLTGAIAMVLLAVIIGWLCFRFSLPTFGFATFTLAICFIALFIVDSISAIREGLVIRYSGTNVWYFQFESKLVFYYILLGMVIGLVILCRYIINSKMGIYFYAIHDNERVAAAGGVDVMWYKIIAFAISAGLTAPVGTFWAQYSHFIAPNDVSPHIPVTVVLLTVIGGSRTLWGPVVGAGILVPVGEVLRIYFNHLPGLHFIIYGLIVVVTLLSLRSGLIPFLEERRRIRLGVRKEELPTVTNS